MISTTNPEARPAAFVLAVWTTIACPDASQTQPLARWVADGKPWTLTMLPENRRATITLRPDGTGTVERGSRTMSPT